MDQRVYTGLVCHECGRREDREPLSGRCVDCGGILDADYDLERFDPASLRTQSDRSMWRFDTLLPLDRDGGVSLGEGATPLLSCPDLADELAVDAVQVKDEGRNPTGAVTDRSISLAISVAADRGCSDVAIAAAGDAGQSTAAYAAPADIAAHVFLPSRAPFATKAMVNVHGGDMTVVGGRLGDARSAATATAAEADWPLLDPCATPALVEGAKTVGYEVLAQRDWTAPDVIVCPTGTGVTLTGIAKAMAECRTLGLIDEQPRLYAAQAAGCAPVVAALERDADAIDPSETPDTICGELEVPAPAAGRRLLQAIQRSDGGAVATEDRAILDAATTIAAATGLSLSPSAAAAASGAWSLAERGDLPSNASVVLIATGSAARSADVLRSHLMGQGI